MTTATRRILLVEDNPGDLLLIKETLRVFEIDYSLDHYTTAAEAMRAINVCGVNGGEIPDLILVDYNLPGGDARDILMAAAKNPTLMPVPKAVVTSSVAPGDRETALQLGAHFIHKPCDLDQFLTVVGAGITSLLEKR